MKFDLFYAIDVMKREFGENVGICLKTLNKDIIVNLSICIDEKHHFVSFAAPRADIIGFADIMHETFKRSIEKLKRMHQKRKTKKGSIKDV